MGVKLHDAKADNNREAMRMELQQIIQTDRMASDIIQRAMDTKAAIEKRCEKEKSAILADVQRMQSEAQSSAEELFAKSIVSQKEDATRHFTEKAAYFQDLDAKNHRAWVLKITDDILHAK